MIEPKHRSFELRILALICILVLCGIWVAGLWPFHSPTNQIAWLADTNGLLFGRHGTAFTSGPLGTSNLGDGTSVSIETWLQPGVVDDSSTILAFFTPEDPRLRFSLRQSDTDLALNLRSQNEHIRAIVPRVVYIDDIFRERKMRFIAITSGTEGTKLYVDGSFVRAIPQFRLSASDFTGRLVLGTSPVVNDSWSGRLRGLAFYEDELSAIEVSRHYETWTRQGRPDLHQNEHVLALYLFDERQGRIVHNNAGSGADIQIPERYQILHEKFLEPPWKEFNRRWSYWKNVGINIGGFIPLGFFFCAYLTLAGKISRPALVTVILGAAVSVTIEVLQAYLPTRDSGMTDIITNTLGTSVGVVLYRWKVALLMKIICRLRAIAA
ncbi:MAG: VanZ family protein [Bryobacteraceae bacterium]